MKKINLIICVLLTFFVAGCTKKGDRTQSDNQPNNQKKISVVATIFPSYDWIRQISMGSENVDISLLVHNGIDMHSFQPSVDDMIKISDCDMFVYVGGVSDGWVEDALRNSRNKNMITVNLLEVLGEGAVLEEFVEGMEHEHEHDEHEHEEHEDDQAEAHHHEEEYDEHVWLSIRNAQFFSKYLAEKLAEIDSKNASLYKDNAEKYVKQLTALDGKYVAELSDVKNDTLLFCDRFPFRYLVDDYGLQYYAAFSGCSAETEASFETVTFLAKKADELALQNVITIEGVSHKIAQTVISNTQSKKQNILMLDSMQSINQSDVAVGATYISIMEKNLDVLAEALN